MKKLMEETEKLKKKLLGLRPTGKEDKTVSDCKSTDKRNNISHDDRL